MKNLSFGIICNTLHLELAKMSREFYKHLPFQQLQINGKNRYYNFKFINDVIINKEKYPFDWVALIDEDCFISNTNEMMKLLYYMIENNYHICGMPDGGLIPLREFNPISINTYFTLMNLKAIRSKYNENEVIKTKYDKSLDIHIPNNLIKTAHVFSKTNYTKFNTTHHHALNFEPYYKIFFWCLKNKYNILYLNANLWDPENDPFTNTLENNLGNIFAYHTWKARHFKPFAGNERILKVYKHAIKEMSL